MFTRKPWKSERRWQLWNNLVMLAFTVTVPAHYLPLVWYISNTEFALLLLKTLLLLFDQPSISQYAPVFLLVLKNNCFCVPSSLSQVIHLGMWGKACGFALDIQFLPRTVACSAWLLYTYLEFMSNTNLQNTWKSHNILTNIYDVWEAACPLLPLKQTRLEGILLFPDKAFGAVI